MPFDMYGVVKIRDSDPEVFWIVLADSSMARGNPLMQSSDDCNEKGFQDQLAKWGLSKARSDELLAAARVNPK
jgi:hypothetical protein